MKFYSNYHTKFNPFLISNEENKALDETYLHCSPDNHDAHEYAERIC